jgi:hypothetical protein
MKFHCRLACFIGGWASILLAQPARAQADSLAVPIPKVGGLTASMLAAGRIANEPHKLTIYLAKDGHQIPAEGDVFRRIEVSFRDSASGTVRVFYPSGKVYSITPYAHIRRGLRHGIETTWSESGKLITRTEFVSGLPRELVSYYPNGQIRDRVVQDQESLLMESFVR